MWSTPARDWKTQLAKALAREPDRIRSTVTPHVRADTIVIGVLRIDVDACQVAVNDDIVRLCPREFGLLRALAQHLGRVLSREQLLELVWPNPEAIDSNRTVDVHIRRLRVKLGDAAEFIHTVNGMGYKLAPTVAVSSKT